MTELLASDEYVKASQGVLRDLTVLIGAHTFQMDGGTVRYAVDFAEIYSFVNPTPQSFESMRPFADRDPRIARILHHAALSRIFFSLPEQLVLLEPYAIEFDDFANGLLEGALPELYEQYGAAASRLANFTATESFKDLVALLKAASQDPDGPALERALKRLEEEAGDLISLLADTSAKKPYWRLASLLKRAEFVDGADYAQDSRHLNAETIARWFAELVRRRKTDSRLACHLDAHAMAIVEHAARQQSSTKHRLYLITRSRHMHDIYADECRSGLWRDANGLPYDPLIDPHTFAILPLTDGAAPQDPQRHVLSELQDLQNSIRVFIEMSGKRSLSPRGDSASEARPSALEEQVRKTREPWRRAAQLASTLFGDFEERTKDLARKRAVEAIVLVRTDLTKPVEDRFASLMKEYEVDYQYLTLKVASLGQPRSNTAVTLNSRSDRSWLAGAVNWMPYRLEFYSQEVCEAISTRPNFVTLQEELRKSPRADVRYERLLSIAYVLGTWQEWKSALDFCELALRAYEEVAAQAAEGGAPAVPDHESHFLLAVCRRELASDAAAYQAALDALDRAATSKAHAKGVEDPRYLKERALVIWRWNSRADDPVFAEPSPPPVTEAVEVSLHAIELATDDPQLRSQLHNNLCFHYLVQLDRPGAREEALRHYEALKALVADPPFPIMGQHLDTLAWAEFTLGLTSDLEALVVRYDRLLKRGRLQKDDRELVKQHRREILKAIAAQAAASSGR